MRRTSAFESKTDDFSISLFQRDVPVSSMTSVQVCREENCRTSVVLSGVSVTGCHPARSIVESQLAELPDDPALPAPAPLALPPTSLAL